jgi:hypothetical protein
VLLPAALPLALPAALPFALPVAGVGVGASFFELHAVLHNNTAPKASFGDNFMLAR